LTQYQLTPVIIPVLDLITAVLMIFNDNLMSLCTSTTCKAEHNLVYYVLLCCAWQRVNIILPSMPRSSEWSLSFRLSNQNFVHISHLPHACYMPCPTYPTWCDRPNGVWWAPLGFLQSPISSSLFSPDILLFSNTLSMCSAFNVRYQISHPYKRTGKTRVLHILIFKFLDSRWENKKFWAVW
jgi:hypothetical protein